MPLSSQRLLNNGFPLGSVCKELFHIICSLMLLNSGSKCIVHHEVRMSVKKSYSNCRLFA